MKKGLVVTLIACMMMIFGIGFSHAALLGIKGSLGYPDIWFSDGTITYAYDSQNNQGFFGLEATDLTLTLSSGDEYYLSGNDYTTKLLVNFTITLDDQKLPVFVSGSMTQWVDSGQVSIGQKTYGENDTLLFGSIQKFGWGEGEELGSFDFLVTLDPDNSLLVKDGIWPSGVPTGIYVKATTLSGWLGSWEEDFTLSQAEGDKAPVPIPGSIALLASGFGFLGLGRFKKLLPRERRS